MRMNKGFFFNRGWTWVAFVWVLTSGFSLTAFHSASALGASNCPIKCCKNFVGTQCLKCNEQCLAENPNAKRLEQLQVKPKKPAAAKKVAARTTAKPAVAPKKKK